MNYQFLCTSHSEQLASHLDATAPIWSSWMRQGEAARRASNLELSVQYFGCAFDLAVLLVERFTAHAEADGLRHCERLLQAGADLAESLARCGHLALRREYLNRIRQLMYQEQLRTPLLADRLPEPEKRLTVTLDAYSGSVRRGSRSSHAAMRAARQSLN